MPSTPRRKPGVDERLLKAGRVTRLQAQSKNPGRVSVFIDGSFAFGLHQDVLLEHGVQQGQVLDELEQARLVDADEVVVAKDRALHLLAYRDRAEQEIRRRLERHGFRTAAVDEVVDRLQELGYLDDARYAREYARGRLETGGYGPERVRRDLMRRGVAREIIDGALADAVEDPQAIKEAAHRQAQKRWQRLQRESDPWKRKKKLHDFLVRRGYSYDTVHQVLDELSRSGDD